MAGAPRVGSKMSDRQMAYAATHGRKVTCTPLIGEAVTGYLVGSDDFHWLVAVPSHQDTVSTVLVHKSAPLVRLSHEATLSDEPENVRTTIEQQGTPFWEYCHKTYFGKSDSRQERAS